MKFNRILALLLSAALLVSGASYASAAEEKKDDAEDEEVIAPLADYTTLVYSSPLEKLATMSLYLENDKFELWGLEETGEIAFVTKATGQILFSNPYDVATMSKDPKTTETKQKILSQIHLKYSNGANEAIMYSYKEAALNRQIVMEPIRGGLRVNYTMGREEARILVPEMIEKSRFEKEILSKMPEKDENGRTVIDEFVNKNPYRYLSAYYMLRDANSEKLSEESRKQLQLTFPITKKFAVYMLSTDTSVKEKKNLEHLLQTYTDYTFDDMEADHTMCEFESKLDALPLFKVAIEYYLDDDGLKVRVPASDIRFSSAFKLSSITVLPYFGAGSTEETGFTLLSDGSGSIVKFEDVALSKNELTITSKVYGQDYSFHQIGGANQEVMRLPAFGVIRNQEFFGFDKEAYDEAVANGLYDEEEEAEETEEKSEDKKDEKSDEKKDDEKSDEKAEEKAEETEEKEETEETAEAEEAEEAGETEEGTEAEGEEETETEAEEPEEEPEEEFDPDCAKSVAFVKRDDVHNERSGYIAYIEEGESLADISTAHGGTVHKYNSTYATFVPRPTDSYALTGISATGNATWSVTSDRKYTGNFTIRYIPVYEEQATTAGMAEALRNYLVNKGILEKLEDDGNDDIPLYLENFGSIKTTTRVAGIPVSVQTPLTTFEDCKDMITELREGVTVDEGTDDEKVLSIPNIIVKYTGWYNGGLYKTVPSKLKVDKAVGGEKGLADLVSFANENGVKIYPDLEFSYVNKVGAFDGFNYKDDAVETIDGRTAVHKVYNSLFQQYDMDGQLIVAASAMNRLYKKVAPKYEKLGIGALSVASVGADLSSDNNEDYPLTREDAKEEVIYLLEQMKEDNGSLLIDGGNAYALPYADHILNVPLDSSENVFASEPVPFLGMVLHGYKNFAGTAINLDGDYEKSLLKAIENGASPYFILSARSENTSELKSFVDFSKYYSIRYNIWKEDLVKTYNTLNEALGSVKYETITSHEYIANRVVKVEYSNGTTFILNYNTVPVEAEGVTVEAMSFVKQ